MRVPTFFGQTRKPSIITSNDCTWVQQKDRLALTCAYPTTTGRNFDEILRVLDSMQQTVKHKVATPANWKNGEEVIIVPSISEAEAKEMFLQGWKTVKPYLRVVSQPA